MLPIEKGTTPVAKFMSYSLSMKNHAVTPTKHDYSGYIATIHVAVCSATTKNQTTNNNKFVQRSNRATRPNNLLFDRTESRYGLAAFLFIENQ